jgi:hypothetical protein
VIEAIRLEVERREITRLCHLTPFRNLVHIATGDGLRSTALLSAQERQAFNQQDLERLDGYPDHICCSIEFPSMWYLRQRRREALGEALLFPDWVCLCLDPRHLWSDTTLFCPRNAAAAGGRLVEAGAEAFFSLYADEVEGSGGRTYSRSEARPLACPTDDQAEVLIHREVPLEDVQQVVVADEPQARRAFVGLTQIGVAEELFDWVVAPEFFTTHALSRMIADGERPTEVIWDHRELVGD